MTSKKSKAAPAKKQSKPPAKETAQNSAKNSAEVSDGRKRMIAAIEPYKFKPGQSGNPGGRPKRKILSDAYKDALELPAIELIGAEVLAKLKLSPDCTMAEAIARSQAITAITDVKSAAQIGDRTEGKPAQKIEMSRNEFAGRSDSELQFFIEHACWPEDAAAMGAGNA